MPIILFSMSHDDPDLMADELLCTCTNRKLRAEEAVVYNIPRADGVQVIVFAKDCPLHGYSVIPAYPD
jgi:hypothetical protein